MTTAPKPCPAKPDAPCEASAEWGGRRGEGDPLPVHLYRPLPPEEPSRIMAAWGSILARRNVPQGHVPYAEWSRLVDDACRERNILLARPRDFTPERMCCSIPAENQWMPIEWLIAYQELFYREAYEDPTFAFDRALLHLPKERVDDILAALTRGEVNYPLVVAPPKHCTKVERKHTPHRVLFDRCIRQQRIAFCDRNDPTVDAYLEQVRDVTLADLTRTDLRDPDGNLVTFDAHGWLPYLQALYPTLPRHAVTDASPTIGFFRWEGNPPTDRVIPGATETIGNKSQLDAVRLRYPLATLPQYLACFAQYHAATGEHLDDLTKQGGTWSRLFGIIDPQRHPDRPSVGACWHHDGLHLYRYGPRGANAGGRLRCAR